MKPVPSIVRLFLVAAAIAPSFAQQERRAAVTDIKPLLRQAIQQGSAHGVLTGQGEAYVRQRFEASSPIHIDVTRLHALPRIGCHRLEITTRQRDVLEGTQRADKELTYQLSYCLDGTR
jgi:hypothetical protein